MVQRRQRGENSPEVLRPWSLGGREEVAVRLRLVNLRRDVVPALRQFGGVAARQRRPTDRRLLVQAQPEARCRDQGLRARADVEHLKDCAYMRFDGALGDVQLARDELVRQPFENQ
jgi:hypothetical protein